MISYHPALIKSSGFHPSHGFESLESDDFLETLRIVTNYNWCPGIFSDGHRCLSSWQRANIIGLDFDDTISLLDAKKSFKDHAKIIGTTMSHQKEKNGIVADRFRVVLFLESVCENVEDYRNTVKILSQQYGSDYAASDAARYFRPCHSIESADFSGQRVDIRRVPAWVKKREELIKQSNIDQFKKRGVLPKFVRDFCERGIVYKQGRNSTAYAVIMMLIDCGMCRGDIERLVLGAPIDQRGLKPREMETVLKSVFSKRSRA